MGVVDSLLRAREAYERREWVAAFESLSDANTADLTGADFARLAAAAYLTGRTNDSIQALQRAYQLQLASGDKCGAVRSAFWSAQVLLSAGESAVGGGWVARAQRLLGELPNDTVEYGYVLVSVLMQHVAAGEFGAAAMVARDITDYGQRFADLDLSAMGLASQGRSALYSGRVRDGMVLMDEAMACVATGGVCAMFAGQIYCLLIEACQEISDFRRAEEWTLALAGWCADQPGLVPFTGQCAVHRGQLMRIHGAYDAALEEFERAVERYLVAGTPGAAGLALAERGDVLRIRGAFPAAENSYTKAIDHGHDPQPGLALLWLARGRTDAALAVIRRLLAEAQDPVHRSRILPAAVDILLVSGETAAASDAGHELTDIAASFGCDGLRAESRRASGCVALARADYTTAAAELRRAIRIWTELGAPYERARCRVSMSRALHGLGDEESAHSELVAARRAFTELAAGPARCEVDRLLCPSTPGGLTPRELEVLRLVAAGHTNPQIAATLMLSEKTVARHLSNIFTKIDVTSRTAATAFAYDHHLL